MSALHEALQATDEAYLVGMSNRGIYKRAVKDLEGAQITVEYTDDAAQVSVSGEVCTLRDPLWESTCSCPSRSVCRHLIAAILYLRDHGEETAGAESELAYVPEEPADAELPEELRTALIGYSAAQLERAFGNQKKVILPMLGDILLQESSILSASFPDGTAVRLIHPIEGSTCSCHSKTLCAHKAAVIAAWQMREGLLSAEDFIKEVTALPAEDAAAVRACAKENAARLADVLEWGLVRLPESMAEHLEAAAVRSHTLRMADAERMMREVGAQLENYRGRRALFRTEDFLRQLTVTAQYMERLQADTLTEEALGQFRKSYEDYPGDLELLPVGQREVFGEEYAGTVYYFLNLDENAPERFLSFSDLRPVFYDTVQARRTAVMPWGAAVTMSTLMHSKMTLVGAKISGGKLSSSSKTQIASRTKAQLDCPAVRALIHDDFRELALWLSTRGKEETQRLCFVHPEKCIRSEFDKHTQTLRMTMADAAGNTVDVCVKYRKELKTFTEELERIGRIMLETPEKPYTWLCIASFVNGRLELFPVEAVNFITVPSPSAYRLPPAYSQRENVYAPEILTFFNDVEGWMCELLQSGIRSAPEGAGKMLSERAARCGMEGLSTLIRDLGTQAEGFRHAMHSDAGDALRSLSVLSRYIQIGREQLELICAILHMQPDSASGSAHCSHP